MIASAPCGPTMDLLSEIGPPGDLVVGMLLSSDQVPHFDAVAQLGTANENRTPSSVTTCLRTVAEGDGDGESRAMPTTATIGGGHDNQPGDVGHPGKASHRAPPQR